MSKVSTDFKAQARSNLEYQESYGSYKSVFSPHWTGSEGDRVALMRIAYPSVQSQRYFNGPVYNAFARNWVSTASMGKAGTIAAPIALTGKDDYTPQVGASQKQYPKVSMMKMTPQQELYLGIVVLLGGISLLMFI